MKIFQAAVVALLLSPLAFAVQAADGDNAPARIRAAEPAPRPTAIRSASEPVLAPIGESSTCDKCEGGSHFKRFWIHTVGGTIGNGLKCGAGKISGAF